MSTLYLGTDLIALADKLAAVLDEAVCADRFVPHTIVVPNRNVRKWLQLAGSPQWRGHQLAIQIPRTRSVGLAEWARPPDTCCATDAVGRRTIPASDSCSIAGRGSGDEIWTLVRFLGFRSYQNVAGGDVLGSYPIAWLGSFAIMSTIATSKSFANGWSARMRSGTVPCVAP